MFLEYQLKALCRRFFEDLERISHEQNQVYSTVLYFIHSAPSLSVLYLNWSNLDAHEKYTLNNQIKSSISKSGNHIYPPVIRAFGCWDIIQDTCGAPGFNCSPIKTELNENTNGYVVKTMMAMESIIKQINSKRKIVQELSTGKDRHKLLSNYKWRIICKEICKKPCLIKSNKNNINYQREEHTNQSDRLCQSGCGDITWFSDFE